MSLQRQRQRNKVSNSAIKPLLHIPAKTAPQPMHHICSRAWVPHPYARPPPGKRTQRKQGLLCHALCCGNQHSVDAMHASSLCHKQPRLARSACAPCGKEACVHRVERKHVCSVWKGSMWAWDGSYRESTRMPADTDLLPCGTARMPAGRRLVGACASSAGLETQLPQPTNSTHQLFFKWVSASAYTGACALPCSPRPYHHACSKHELTTGSKQEPLPDLLTCWQLRAPNAKWLASIGSLLLALGPNPHLLASRLKPLECWPKAHAT